VVVRQQEQVAGTPAHGAPSGRSSRGVAEGESQKEAESSKETDAAVDRIIYSRYARAMSESTTIRVSRATRDLLRDLAERRGETLTETVSRGARLLEQEAIGRDLAAPLHDDERAWLDADAG